MTIKCRTLSFSIIFVIILNTVNLISHQHHCQYHHQQQPGWHRYDINSQSSLDVLIKHVSYYYTDIYFDISCEGGGGVFIFRLIAWGGSENLYGPWGGYKKPSR